MAWAENAFVVRGNLLYERVHDADRAYNIRGKKVLTAVSVYNDDPDYGIYGVTDCIECTPSAGGVQLCDGRRYELCIVEYKPTAPKDGGADAADAMQLFAQKLCVDRVFGCNCAGAIYYANVKKRVMLPLNENFSEYDAKLRVALAAMRAYAAEGAVPPRPPQQNCNGCSLKDVCLPLKKKRQDVRSSICRMLEEETCESC